MADRCEAGLASSCSSSLCACARLGVGWSTMSAVLEGSSSELSGARRLSDASRSAESSAPEVARPREPRREIWFRRRTNVFTALRELWGFRELTVTLAERDLRVRYKQAVLGVAWAVIAPVVMMLAFTVIFNRFAKVDTGGVPYALFS